MKLIKCEEKYLLYKKIGKVNIITTTANSDFGINPKFDNYKDNMDFIKNKFGLLKLCTLSQTHSNIVHLCDFSFVNGIEGDGLITNKQRCGIGVFTADCVPIFMYDRCNNVISMIHSGWRGTYDEIIVNAIDLFISKYGCDINNIEIFIGPHNKVCCYEVGDELIEKFISKNVFKENLNIFSGKNLNLIECIKSSAINRGISEKNINSCEYCTYCSENIKFYSYRKDKNSLNRIFSFIFMD